MKILIWAVCMMALTGAAEAQNPVGYELRYGGAGAGTVSVTMALPESVRAPASLVMPRNYPGGYEQIPYDSFVSSVSALSAEGKSLGVVKDADGPRWSLGRAGETVQRIEYRVDVSRMEAQILGAVSTSKVRQGYVGLLGYSVLDRKSVV